MTRLLLDENVILVQPALVRALGHMIDAAVLQQLHYWLGRSRNDRGGYRWVYKTTGEWADEIGVTDKQAKSALQRLERSGLVESCQPEGSNRRKWYRIDYEHALFRDDDSGRWNGPTGPVERTTRADGTDHTGRCKDTETTTEITTEITTQTRANAERLAHLLADLIADNGSRRPNVTRAWIDSLDRTMRLDGRGPDEIEAAMRWAQADDFWRANILSPDKLRKHYDRLRLQAGRSRSRPLAGVADYLAGLD